MKKNFILLVFVLVASSSTSFGQLYERVFAESNELVQNKMNENKMNGLNILSGIQTKHTVILSGLTNSQKANFESQLSSQADILSFELSADLSSLIVDSKATYSKEMLLELIQSFQLNLVNYSSEFSVQ